MIDDLEKELKRLKKEETGSKTRPVQLQVPAEIGKVLDFNTIEEALEHLQEISSEEIPSGMPIEAPTPSTSYVPAPTTYVAPTSYVPAPTKYVEPARAISAPTTYVEPRSYTRDNTWWQQRYRVICP